MYTNLNERFWSKVNKLEKCWEWTASSRGNGYGAFKYKGKVIDAHRFVWELTFGCIPNNLYVCHTCDNRKCVNPEHLFLGTPKENVLDAIRKGRMPQNGRVPLKLNEEKVLQIRKDLKTTGKTNRELGKEFNVDHSLISLINRNKIWCNI